ncbi:collinsiaVII-like protein [Tanacetum coccineum]
MLDDTTLSLDDGAVIDLGLEILEKCEAIERRRERFSSNKRVLKVNSLPPISFMHSPPRPVNVKDHQNWKIPLCISYWQNPKWYTILLDKRLDHDDNHYPRLELTLSSRKLQWHLKAADETGKEGKSNAVINDNEHFLRSCSGALMMESMPLRRFFKDDEKESLQTDVTLGKIVILRLSAALHSSQANAFEGQAEALHHLANGLIQRALALHRQAQALNRKAKALHLQRSIKNPCKYQYRGGATSTATTTGGGKTVGRWLKDKIEKKKEEIRVHNAHLHATVSVFGVATVVAAALAAATAASLGLRKDEEMMKTDMAVASATSLN